MLIFIFIKSVEMVGWESYDEKAVLRIADIFQKYSKNKTTHRLFFN